MKGYQLWSDQKGTLGRAESHGFRLRRQPEVWLLMRLPSCERHCEACFASRGHPAVGTCRDLSDLRVVPLSRDYVSGIDAFY